MNEFNFSEEPKFLDTKNKFGSKINNFLNIEHFEEIKKVFFDYFDIQNDVIQTNFEEIYEFVLERTLFYLLSQEQEKVNNAYLAGIYFVILEPTTEVDFSKVKRLDLHKMQDYLNESLKNFKHITEKKPVDDETVHNFATGVLKFFVEYMYENFKADLVNVNGYTALLQEDVIEGRIEDYLTSSL